MEEYSQTQQELEFVVKYIKDRNPDDRDEFNSLRLDACSEKSLDPPPNRALVQAYKNLVQKESIEQDEEFLSFMQKNTIRNMSGIAVVTSLLKPYMCPADCVYCPTEKQMPKSYIASEPAAQRAQQLDFSPYKQMRRRVNMLEESGHNTDKIEFITKGGTWNAYPLKYQYWFMLESFKACNNFKRKHPKPPTDEEDWDSLEELQAELEEEKEYNETSNHRIIGVTFETRPDAIAESTVAHMRKQGCTRVELGLQATDDEILENTRRGHTVEQFREAMFLLRKAGFKVDLHFMPDLPGSTPQKDVEMYKEVFSDEGLKPDMIKIYPTVVVESADLYNWLQEGKYDPHSEKDLFNALKQMKLETPRYCRISRLIRDIPEDEIEGDMVTNLREELQKTLAEEGKRCVCIRCREIGRQKDNIDSDAEVKLFTDEYKTEGGEEKFISIEDEDRTGVFGFLRLRLPEKEYRTDEEIFDYIPEVEDCAFIRELHVYGKMAAIGKDPSDSSQHKGFGKQMMVEAESQARKAGFDKIAVISGVGVRKYYENQFGYKKEGTYMVKNLD
jgi:elongator complex protein 3